MPPSSLASRKEEPLPDTFIELNDVLNENVTPGRLINVIGTVTDCRAPVKTNGTDFKSCWTLKDLSIEDEPYGIALNIFRPEKAMPKVSAADVAVLLKVKVQRYQNNISLITNHGTTIRVYKSPRIPRPPNSAKVALTPPSCPGDSRPEPTDQINRYVSVFYQKLDKYSIPDDSEFKERLEVSMHVKDKFSLLKDVQEGSFHDLIVCVVRAPYYDHDGKATLYVSDYTENPKFHLQTWEGLIETGGDPWGYTSAGVATPKRDWQGPDGKKSMQVTIYPPHANVLVEDEVTIGKWLYLRNVQIKYGRDGNNLEGFLREDQKYPTKINLSVFDLESGTRDSIDPRLRSAYQRFKASETGKKRQKKSIAEAKVAGESLKRKASEPALNDKDTTTLNRKARRLQQRAAREQNNDTGLQHFEQKHPENQLVVVKEKKVQQAQKVNRIGSPDLGSHFNGQVTCESHYENYTTIKSMLEPAYFDKEIDGEKVTLPLPFVNHKYQSHVRVVDFWPDSLEDFAVSRKKDQLRDIMFSDGESSSGESGSILEEEDDDEPTSSASRAWEWSFALHLEDVPLSATVSPSPKSSVWVIVNNAAGQCLTDLDATDLRKNPRVLAKLREKMGVLWGNLEDINAEQEDPQNLTSVTKPNKGKGVLVPKPTLTSSGTRVEEKLGASKELDSKPFMCCIQQYGVKDPETKEWVRTFGMFGVRIRSSNEFYS
ncbi:hypothetical protein QBC38DRAFT_493347 [Podospora fimiseda]|uniref:Protection of telomeres protein 1 n=1 Tax=Podospora fimiseda TaxID=252190 RepID=A0AAN6YK79_9PEZI|nr:hypothetical protein QBC38DRAFT_493347 [Podospora fimiseda]